MKKLLLPAIVFATIALFVYGRHHSPFSGAPTSAPANDSVFASALEKHASNIHVEGRGTVAKILPDDNDGSRHQRFIVRLSSGQTILIAHNIDRAPRVSSLNEGDIVSFSGEYEWNPKGGVVHWTHRDSDGRHSAGWIRHDGQAFQ
jgi:uncharacterized protein DUF3465